jgi:uncharacterized protein (DUF302 family)
MLRRALAMERLRVPYEFDAAARVRQELGIGLKQHVVLYVDDPIQLLEATVMHPAAGLFIPEPVVLSSTNDVCRISVRSIEPLFASELPASVRGAVSNVHERILSAVQRVALKEMFTTGGPVSQGHSRVVA